MARYERPDVAPGVYVEGGQYYYKGRPIGSAAVGNKSMLDKQLASIDEEESRATTKQTGLDIADKQTQLAQEFSSNVPKYTGLLQDQAKKTIQRNLAEKMTGLKQQSSSRGFLKGSGTQRQQAEALAGSQAETMEKEADIADAVKTQAKQFENQALATKMSLQGSANQATIDALRQNILDTQRQGELWKALGNVAGIGAGYYMAKG